MRRAARAEDQGHLQVSGEEGHAGEEITQCASKNGSATVFVLHIFLRVLFFLLPCLRGWGARQLGSPTFIHPLHMAEALGDYTH